MLITAVALMPLRSSVPPTRSPSESASPFDAVSVICSWSFHISANFLRPSSSSLAASSAAESSYTSAISSSPRKVCVLLTFPCSSA